MAISTGAALAMGGSAILSSLLGGIFGSSSQASANRTNLEATRETNEMNKELFNQSLAWQEEMWNKTNEYNSPKEAMARLRAAGINPMLSQDFGDASMPSSVTPPTMQAGHVNPVDYSWIPKMVDNGVNAFFNNQILSNEVVKGANDAQISKVNAEFELSSLKYKLQQVVNDTHKSSYEREQAAISLNILNQTQQNSVKQSQWQTDIMQKEFEKAVNDIAESKLRQEAQNIANQYAPELNEQQLRQYQANVKAAYSAAAANDAAAVESAARKALTDLQAEGVKLSNQEKDSILDAIIDKAWSEADDAYWHSQESAKIFRVGKRESEIWPGNNVDGRSYTNYSKRPQGYRGRIKRDKNGKVIIPGY